MHQLHPQNFKINLSGTPVMPFVIPNVCLFTADISSVSSLDSFDQITDLPASNRLSAYED